MLEKTFQALAQLFENNYVNQSINRSLTVTTDLPKFRIDYTTGFYHHVVNWKWPNLLRKVFSRSLLFVLTRSGIKLRFPHFFWLVVVDDRVSCVKKGEKKPTSLTCGSVGKSPTGQFFFDNSKKSLKFIKVVKFQDSDGGLSSYNFPKLVSLFDSIGR